MNWKKYLRILELDKQWDQAIEFMQDVIRDNPDDMDAYIYMNFLLMNLLGLEDYEFSKHDHYASLLKRYFNESYIKFSNNAEYLFCTATTAVFSEWYMGLTVDDYEKMFAKAMELEPENLLYKKTYYLHLDKFVSSQQAEKLAYAKLALQENSPLIKEWGSRGALGAYLKSRQIGWAKDVLDWEVARQDPQVVWKAQLSRLSFVSQRDQAIEFMRVTIRAYPNDMDAYIYMNFLLMNLLVNEKFDEDKHDYYASLLKKYFYESYAKFSNNAEYLFCTGVTAIMDEEYLGLAAEDAYKMLIRAMELEPDNILYKSADYLYLNHKISNQNIAAIEYAQQVLQMGSKIRNKLLWYNDFYEYLSEEIIKWAEGVIAQNSKAQ
jgi:hypothetical protein